MSVESVEDVIELWRRGKITAEQAIEKILTLLCHMEERLYMLEREAYTSDS